MAISPSPFDRIQNKRRAGSRAWVWWVVALVALVVLALVLRAQAASLFWQAVAPVTRLRNALGASEAAALRAQLASTTAALADRNALAQEVADLRARLGRADAPGRRLIAGVLQSPPWTAYDTLVIDAGAAQGVAAGQRVSAGGNLIIGSISEVYANQSRVELVSTPGASYQALLNGTVPVAVEGQGGGSMSAQVPAGTPARVGDSVAFPGLAGGIVAQVSAVSAAEGESFTTVYMQLPVNPADLSRVEVLLP
jgi:cell shape-determining protein MreC